MTSLFKILLKLDGCQKNIMCRNCKKAKAYTNIKFLLALRTSGLWRGSTGRPIWGKFGVTLCYNHLQYTRTNSSLLRLVYIQRTSRSIAGQQQEVKYLNHLLFLLFPWTRRHNAHTHCIDVIHICSKSFCSEFFVFGKKFVWHSNILILIFVWRFFLLLFDANFCWNFAWSSDAIVCLILQRVHQRWMRQEVVTNHLQDESVKCPYSYQNCILNFILVLEALLNRPYIYCLVMDNFTPSPPFSSLPPSVVLCWLLWKAIKSDGFFQRALMEQTPKWCLS